MTISTDGNRRLLNRTGAGIAGALICMLGTSMWMLMRYEIPEKNHDIILIMVTTLANSVIAIVGYFFGSSVSNRSQGEIIATQAATIASAQDKLAPVAGMPDKTVTLPAGDSVAVKAEDPKP